MNTASAQSLTLLLRLGVAWCGFALATVSHGQSAAELDELKINLLASASRVKELETRLTASERQVQAANHAAAAASIQSKDALLRYENLRSALSGLGAGAILEGNGGDAASRLLQALAELKATKEQLSLVQLQIQTALEKASAPGADLSAILSDLNRAEGSGSDVIAGVSQVVAVKPELGLAIVSAKGGQPLQAGAKVEILLSNGSSVQGSVVESREGSACVAYQRGLGLSANVEVGSQVNVSVSNKL